MDTGHGPGQEQDQEKYAFLQEVIKDEQLDRKKILEKIAKLVGKGLVFGMAVCIGFFVLKPWAETTFQKDVDEVEIPMDEETDKIEEAESVEAAEYEMTIQSYQELNEALGEVAKEAQKSMVQVTGILQGESWIGDMDSSSHVTSGLIVADNGRELLILTNYTSMRDMQLFQVEFADGTRHEATMKQKDSNIDMVIFSVARSGITQETWDKIKVASLGNSNTLYQGNALIAVGSPFGYEDGLGYGSVSSLGESMIYADGEFDLIITDMPGAKNSSGVLFNTSGYVVGIINSKLIDENDSGILAAVGISAVKSEIELMSNGKNVPYIGVIGTMITEEMSEVHNLPVGLYVSEVEVDSPAMKAGIQSGDVITKFGGQEITSLENYHKIVLEQEAGKNVVIFGQRQGSENYVDIKFNVTVGIKQ